MLVDWRQAGKVVVVDSSRAVMLRCFPRPNLAEHLHSTSTSTAPAPVSVSALLNLQFSNFTPLLLSLLCYWLASYILKETIVLENKDIYPNFIDSSTMACLNRLQWHPLQSQQAYHHPQSCWLLQS